MNLRFQNQVVARLIWKHLVDFVLREKINFDKGIAFTHEIHLWEVLQFMVLITDKQVLERKGGQRYSSSRGCMDDATLHSTTVRMKVPSS